MLKFTYPNEETKGVEGEGDGWISTKFAAPVNKDMLERNILESIHEIGTYHDRDKITTANIVLTWTTSSGKGCSLEEVPLEIGTRSALSFS